MRCGSGFFLLADALGHEQRGPTLRDAFGGHGDLADVIATRQLEHDVGHHLFQDGAQAARARAALIAFWAMALSASFSTVSRTSSSSNSFWYCFVRAFFGSMRIRMSASSSSASSGTTTGSRPTSSG